MEVPHKGIGHKIKGDEFGVAFETHGGLCEGMSCEDIYSEEIEHDNYGEESLEELIVE